ncbi:unnamed protein product, partial [Meganyctiphanes norvegica]
MSETSKVTELEPYITRKSEKKKSATIFFNHAYVNFEIDQLLDYSNRMTKFPKYQQNKICLMITAAAATFNNLLLNLKWADIFGTEHDDTRSYEFETLESLRGRPPLSSLTQDNQTEDLPKVYIENSIHSYDFLPFKISFILPRDYKDFCDAHAESPSTWIIKPIDSAQGRGIYVADQVDQVSPEDIQLVSRYLDSPLLINGYKFDLRLYAVVTSLNPLVIYLYEDGLVRLAAEKYQTGEELWNPCIHLTNYSINKFNSNYVQNEEAGKDNHGNKWSLSAFLRHLKTQNVDTVTLMRNLENVVTRTILAASGNMKVASERLLKHPNTCFELFGFDILIDKELKPWVLEVNLSPSLNINQPIDLKIKSALVADLFSLVGMKICDSNSTDKDQSYCKRKYSHYLSTTNYICNSPSCNKECVAEELRVLHQVCDEYKRRGGWNRIFPTEDSWNLYNGILEYETPLNLVLHKHLYPQVPRSIRVRHDSPCRTESALTLGATAFLQRMSCYERPLDCGLDDGVDNNNNKRNTIIQEKQTDSEELLENKVNALTATGDNQLMSKYRARIAFLAYLQKIQRNLMNGMDKEESVEMVARFLQASGKMLQKHFTIHIPYKGIPIKARATILSRQLGDFMNQFNKETFVMMDEDLNSTKPPQICQSSIESLKSLPEGPSIIPSKTNKPFESSSLHQKIAKNSCQA